MELQPIEWNSSRGPDIIDSLYLKGNGISPDSEGILFQNGGTADFLSYFNLINWERWRKYTSAMNLFLELELEGSFSLNIRSHPVPESTEVLSEPKLILTAEIENGGSVKIPVPVDGETDIVSFELTTKKGGKLLKGSWTAELSSGLLKKPKIALIMVTYNRDEYLFRNLETLKTELPESFSVFVVDNASRLSKETVAGYGPRVKLFHNNNTGGTGGFTRGLTEALLSSERFTHVLFMDDDVTINTFSLKKTATILSLLKDDFTEHFISGAMFRMDTPWVLHEASARWNGIKIISNKHNLDMRKKEHLLFSEKEELSSDQYAAWWYCLIPLSSGIGEDLPFPFFIYGDDIEYSLRRAGGIISWNGLCVWHEPFEKKHSKVLKSYFLCRNLLAVNTIHHEKYGFLFVLIGAAVHFFVQVFVHDYDSASLVLDALRDYLKGADFLLNCSNEAILHEKRELPSKMVRYDAKTAAKYFKISQHYKKFKAPFYFFKKRIAALDYEGTHMELRERSILKTTSLIWQFIALYLQLFAMYGIISKLYRKKCINIPFWNKKNFQTQNWKG